MFAILVRVVAALAALVLSVNAAQAKNTTRSCDGNYLMKASLVDGIPPTKSLDWSMGDFATTASCGSTEPDHCRVIARDRLFRCYREHYADRWSRKRPEICRQVQRYGIDDIKTVMEQKVCCSENALPYRDISITLYGVTNGQGPCAVWIKHGGGFNQQTPRRSMIASDYKMECTTVRANLCPHLASAGALRIEHRTDRPGSDYHSFDEKNLSACRNACKKDARCKAFTWQRAGAVRPIARCWLKDSVPPKVSNNCCESGFK